MPWQSAWKICKLASGDARFVLASSDHIALERSGEIKGVILFLTSSAASWVTGQTVVVDGEEAVW